MLSVEWVNPEADLVRRRRLLVLILVLVGCFGLGLVLGRRHFRPRTSQPRRGDGPRPTVSQETFPLRPPIEAPRVAVVYKKRRALVLYVEGRRHAVYPIGLGWDPTGHKERQGDGRTPEGTYYVCTRNPRSQFHLFLGLSYPNAHDGEGARRAGLISQAELRRIRSANRSKRQPPWNTALGGEIGIHGHGAGRDWTAGCIALENDDIEEVWSHLRVKDPVVIFP